ncbi:hypothetical protein PGT21_005926 [Puccinia graminis f. sp. tritici]|uniref:Uncharacterized protein n=1 Tax=Puccinia graminis f. sp. tritici TaxID=56615 RepID=A0A5B0PPC0_PUCGR|nr:hypothetical protein PGT21_005926 [Puccinia graminis f. sp. tritici]
MEVWLKWREDDERRFLNLLVERAGPKGTPISESAASIHPSSVGDTLKPSNILETRHSSPSLERVGLAKGALWKHLLMRDQETGSHPSVYPLEVMMMVQVEKAWGIKKSGIAHPAMYPGLCGCDSRDVKLGHNVAFPYAVPISIALNILCRPRSFIFKAY